MQEEGFWSRDLSKAFSTIAQTTSSETDAKRIARGAFDVKWAPWPTQQQALDLAQVSFPDIKFPPCEDPQSYLDDSSAEKIAAAIYSKSPVELLLHQLRKEELNQELIDQVSERQLEAVLLRLVFEKIGIFENKPTNSKVQNVKAILDYLKKKEPRTKRDTRTRGKQKREDRDGEDKDDEDGEQEDLQDQGEEAKSKHIISLLTKVRAACINRPLQANLANPDVITLEIHMASLLDDSNINIDIQRSLLRGAYIDVNLKLDKSWQNIATSLHVKAKVPKTAARIAGPLALFKLVVSDGLYKLRFLEEKSVSLTMIQANYTGISAHFKQHPEDLVWWQEGQTPPAAITLLNDAGKAVGSVDKKWLTGRQ
jgi:hypothetical protein